MRGGVVEPNDQSKGDGPDDPGATAPRDGLEEGEVNPMDWLPGGQPDLAGRACRHTMMCVYCFTTKLPACVCPVWSWSYFVVLVAEHAGSEATFMCCVWWKSEFPSTNHIA